MATIALYSCAFPRNTFLIFFVIPCPAWVFLPGVLIYDGWRSFSDQVCPFSQRATWGDSFRTHEQRTRTDTPGHVGGLLSGIGYFLWRVALRK